MGAGSSKSVKKVSDKKDIHPNNTNTENHNVNTEDQQDDKQIIETNYIDGDHRNNTNIESRNVNIGNQQEQEKIKHLLKGHIGLILLKGNRWFEETYRPRDENDPQRPAKEALNRFIEKYHCHMEKESHDIKSEYFKTIKNTTLNKEPLEQLLEKTRQELPRFLAEVIKEHTEVIASFYVHHYSTDESSQYYNNEHNKMIRETLKKHKPSHHSREDKLLALKSIAIEELLNNFIKENISLTKENEDYVDVDVNDWVTNSKKRETPNENKKLVQEIKFLLSSSERFKSTALLLGLIRKQPGNVFFKNNVPKDIVFGIAAFAEDQIHTMEEVSNLKRIK